MIKNAILELNVAVRNKSYSHCTVCWNLVNCLFCLKGQETRNHVNSELAFAAIGVEGASLSNKDMLTAGVLQHLMGAGQYIKYGSNVASSRLNQSAAKATPLPYSVSVPFGKKL